MKTISKIIIAAVILLAGASMLTSCDSASSAAFREGWNSTAPAEYRY